MNMKLANRLLLIIGGAVVLYLAVVRHQEVNQCLVAGGAFINQQCIGGNK